MVVINRDFKYFLFLSYLCRKGEKSVASVDLLSWTNL